MIVAAPLLHELWIRWASWLAEWLLTSLFNNQAVTLPSPMCTFPLKRVYGRHIGWNPVALLCMCMEKLWMWQGKKCSRMEVISTKYFCMCVTPQSQCKPHDRLHNCGMYHAVMNCTTFGSWLRRDHSWELKLRQAQGAHDQSEWTGRANRSFLGEFNGGGQGGGP